MQKVVVLDCVLDGFPLDDDLPVQAACVFYRSSYDPRLSARQRCFKTIDMEILRKSRNHVIVEVPEIATSCRFDLMLNHQAPKTMAVKFCTHDGERVLEMRAAPWNLKTLTIDLAADDFRMDRFGGFQFLVFAVIVFLCAFAVCRLLWVDGLNEKGECQIDGRVKRRVEWIDLAKFFAIVAVMMDHTNNLLYTDQRVAYLSYCSVGVFILMMGVVSFWSYDRSSVPGLRKAVRNCWGIFRPYIAATIIYCLFRYKALDFDGFVSHVVRFSASGPLYYVLLYMQLALVAPLVFRILSAIRAVKSLPLRCGLDLLFMALALGFSWLTTNYTNILGVYGGGGKLMGGTFFFLLCVGMWGGRQIRKGITSAKVWILIVLFAIVLSATGAWWQFIFENKNKLDEYLRFGRGNPPGVNLGLYAILVSATLFLMGNLLDRLSQNNILRRLYGFLAFFGRHTLYIFLYHSLFIEFIFGWLFAAPYGEVGNIWMKRVLYYTGMIGGSLAIEFAFGWLRGIAVPAYFQSKPCSTGVSQKIVEPVKCV